MFKLSDLQRAGGAFRVGAVLTLAGLLVAGMVLRLSDPGGRALHADEATGARLVADRLEQREYQFDPTHYHGPLLTAVAAAWCRVLGERDWVSLEISTLRQVVVWSGVGAVLLAGYLAGVGRQRLLVMAVVSTSPFLIYYSRMFIHEPYLVFFAALALSGLVMGTTTGSRRGLAALLVGLGVGGMAVTRETFVISLFAWSAAGLLWMWRGDGLKSGIFKDHLRHWWAPALGSAGLAGLMVFWFYSSGGRHPGGVLDFFRTYFVYETTVGHEKSWGYYFELLVWPKYQAGRWWSEGALLLVALMLYLPAIRRNAANLRYRFFLEAGLLHLIIFSLISYKTPWLAMLGWFHICLAASGALIVWMEGKKFWRPMKVGAVLLALLIFQIRQSDWAVGRLASDSRNPYAYVPTSRDVESIGPLIETLQAIDGKDGVLPVVGTQYWPLPWYLRECGRVGYWPEWKDELKQWPILILLPTAPEAAGAIESSHVLLPKGLRHEFPVTIAVENSLWNRYLEEPQ